MALGHTLLLAATLTSARTPALANGGAPLLPACLDRHISVEGTLFPRWADQLQHICVELPSWRKLDPTIQVGLRSTPASLDVTARSGDGRTARRELQTPEELRSTLKALMTIPEQTPLAPSAASTPPIADHLRATEPLAPDVPERVSRRTEPNDAARIGIHLLLAATGRVSGAHGYESGGVEGAAGLSARRWSFAVTARWDALNVKPARPSGFEMDALGVGFVVSRRLLRWWNRLAFDAGATATLLTESQSFQSAQGERLGSTTDARLGLVGLASWGSSSLRGALLLEGELSPARLKQTMRLGDGFPALPAWSVGLGAGIVWGDP